jgi:hypothetical protein
MPRRRVVRLLGEIEAGERDPRLRDVAADV